MVTENTTPTYDLRLVPKRVGCRRGVRADRDWIMVGDDPLGNLQVEQCLS